MTLSPLALGQIIDASHGNGFMIIGSCDLGALTGLFPLPDAQWWNVPENERSLRFAKDFVGQFTDSIAKLIGEK